MAVRTAHEYIQNANNKQVFPVNSWARNSTHKSLVTFGIVSASFRIFKVIAVIFSLWCACLWGCKNVTYSVIKVYPYTACQEMLHRNENLNRFADCDNCYLQTTWCLKSIKCVKLIFTHQIATRIVMKLLCNTFCSTV